MVDTCETLRSACGILKQAGAKAVYAVITHGELPNATLSVCLVTSQPDALFFSEGLLSNDALDKLREMPIEKLVVSGRVAQANV